MRAKREEALHEHGPSPEGDLVRFGAELLPRGSGVNFHFFAPACWRVYLQIFGESHSRLMQVNADGWHELTMAEAAAGVRYRFLLPDGHEVPDPASRYQPEGLAGPSEVTDPKSFTWTDSNWRGTPWHQTVLYELHVGTFTAEGSFLAAIRRLDHLCALGVTAIELMSVSDFAGTRNWGYDSVLLYAPASAYGRPDDLKALIDAAHARRLTVILDVVYNHFGPEGNYLPVYFPQMFSIEHTTAWGPGLNFDGEGSHEAREFILRNALYWLEEFHFDGLRLDAAHAMIDNGPRHILDELADRVHRWANGRHVHLILENEQNIAQRLERDGGGSVISYTAQWNHDIDHLLGSAFQGTENDRQQEDNGETERLGKCLAEGFVIAAEEKGDRFASGCHVPPTAFVSFIQSHDLIGNRVLGERIFALLPEEPVRAIIAVYLLLPQVPMLFMGEEWGASTPFPFFCDFPGSLSDAVQKGRCEQLSKLPGVSEEELKHTPNCQAESTFMSAKLNWDERVSEPHQTWLQLYGDLLRIRHAKLAPLLSSLKERCGQSTIVGPGGLVVAWQLYGKMLRLSANLWHTPRPGFASVPGSELLWLEGFEHEIDSLGPWSVRWELVGSE